MSGRLRQVAVRAGLALAMLVCVVGFAAGSAGAQRPSGSPAGRGIAGWEFRGVTVVPNSPTDLASGSFRASVREARRDGANAISVVVQYFQPSRTSSDVHTTDTTPTRAALSTGIAYVHSLHMRVALKVLIDVTPPRNAVTPLWRWYIDPRNRRAWFRRVTQFEVGLARLRPDLIVIGTEMGTLTSVHPATADWINLIGHIRRVYRGLLTYEAQTPSGYSIGQEAGDIGFWHDLDFVTLSGYSALATTCDPSQAGIDQAWEVQATDYYLPLERRLDMPIVFGEIGYSSMRCDDEHPWEYFQADPGAPVDLAEQAGLYAAFFAFWNEQSGVDGAFIWNWMPSPGAGGPHNRDFTPQGKPAEKVLRAAFTSRA